VGYSIEIAPRKSGIWYRKRTPRKWDLVKKTYSEKVGYGIVGNAMKKKQVAESITKSWYQYRKHKKMNGQRWIGYRRGEKKEKSYCRFRPGFSLALKPWMKAPSQRRRVDVSVVVDRVWITAIRKLSSKSMLCNCVCVDTGESGLLVTDK